MFKIPGRILIFILVIVVLLSTGTVFGEWIYPGIGPSPSETFINITLKIFEYPPEEVLPGGGNEEAELGQNHYTLIDRILNERDKGYGLNINDNVLLHQYLRKQPVVYSNQKVSGGNLKFILDPKTDTDGLYYCIEKGSDTEYYAYTFSVSDLETYAGTNHEIPVYKTTLLKTDKWNATVSYLGYAKVIFLSDLGYSSDPNCLRHTIDVSSWHI